MDTQDHIDLARRHRTTGNSVVASMELLVEIRDLLRAQAGAPPSMPVVVPAARPGVQDATHAESKFRCAQDDDDYIHIQKSPFRKGAVKVTWQTKPDNDSYVTLSPERAKSLAYTLLQLAEEG